jgi:hypothetical protein
MRIRDLGVFLLSIWLILTGLIVILHLHFTGIDIVMGPSPLPPGFYCCSGDNAKRRIKKTLLRAVFLFPDCGAA